VLRRRCTASAASLWNADEGFALHRSESSTELL
jgi:hypothetical protein